MIENVLYTEKRNAKKCEQISSQIAGLSSIDEIAKALSVEATSRKDISFSPMSAAAVEPAVLGAVLRTETGALSGAVQGTRAVYVVKVDNKVNGTFYTKDDATRYTTQKAQYGSQLILPVMQDAAGVVDERARYF